ncbi:MAG: hypothetical protein L0I76_17760 [Pseudonocardia sp.]|nr:hypothetical protein [Pseudonocardia sp.]
MTASTGKSAPLGIPTLVGEARTARTATATVLVMPVEVYTTGVLVRVRAQLSELPDELADNPGHALVAMPGHERGALTVSSTATTTAGARSVSSASARSDGPCGWDVEFWLPPEWCSTRHHCACNGPWSVSTRNSPT